VTLSKQLLENIFKELKDYIVDLEKMLKSNDNSIIKTNQNILAEKQSQLVLEDELGNIAGG
jgi:hypothetical protein